MVASKELQSKPYNPQQQEEDQKDENSPKEAETSKKPTKASKRKSGADPVEDSESPPAKKPKATQKQNLKKATPKPTSAKGKNAKTVRSAVCAGLGQLGRIPF